MAAKTETFGLAQHQASIGSLIVFCKAAELLSFHQAAIALGVSAAAISRNIARLEARLGTLLFRRTTRQMQLTEDGAFYFEQCQAALQSLEQAELVLAGQKTDPKGVLRVSVPSTYAHYRLLPALPRFYQQYPRVQIEISIANRNIDFVDEGFDLAIRLGQPPDSRLIAKKLEDAQVGVYASTDYLKRYGKPTGLEQLKDGSHTALPFLLPSTGKPLPWIFLTPLGPVDLVPRASTRVSDDPLGCVSLARAGLGLVQTFSWIGKSHHADLQPVLQKFSGRTRPFFALYLPNKHRSIVVQSFVDFLLQRQSFAPL
jgi:DNA-binding transcriptional LysR family regulator